MKISSLVLVHQLRGVDDVVTNPALDLEALVH